MAKTGAERMQKCRAAKKAQAALSTPAARLQPTAASTAAVKPGALRMRKHRAQKAAAALFAHAAGDAAQPHQMPTTIAKPGAERMKKYRQNMTPQTKARHHAKARENSKKWRRIRKDRFSYASRWDEQRVFQAKRAAQMKLYRSKFSLEKKMELAAKSVIRSRQYRLKFRRDAPGERERFFWKHRCFKNKTRYKKYNIKRVDTTALARSSKRRHCNHPPCRDNRLNDGMMHRAKRCQILYPGARQTYMEEQVKAGMSSAVYDPSPGLVYADEWSRKYVRKAHYCDKYVSPIYVLHRGQRVFVDIEDDGLMYLYNAPDEDEHSLADSDSDGNEV